MDKEKQIRTEIIEEYKDNELVHKKERKYFVPKDEQITNDTLIVAWEFSKKDNPFVGVFEKKNDHLYVEHKSNKNEGYFALKGYRKQSDTAREFAVKVMAQGNITYSRYEGKEYIEIPMEKFNKIAEEYGVKIN